MNDIWLPLIMGFLVGAIVVGGSAMYIRQDVLERYSQAESLSDSAAELLEVLAPAGMVLNASNVIVRVTGGALASGLVDGRTLSHKKLNDLVSAARETDEIQVLDDELQTRLKGAKLYISARAKSIGDGNVLPSVDDRTESYRLDKMRKDFMANISHELKTPIGAVGLLAEAMENSLDQPEVLAKLVKNIGKEAKRLSALVKDIIQLSRIQGSANVTSTEVVNLIDVVKDAIDRNSWRSEKTGIEVGFTAAEERVEVYGDAEMLTVAVKNLVENAIIYSNKGDVVQVVVESGDDVAKILVKDSGIGIPKEEQARVFERFYRVDQSRSRETGGTGLGLSIVKHAAMSHLGDVQLFSKPGVGSTFTLRLPSVAKKTVKQSKRKANRG
ncbi:MAG: sensor histidine kinase [Micrococcales bacterium]